MIPKTPNRPDIQLLIKLTCKGRKRDEQQGSHPVRYGMLNRKPLTQSHVFRLLINHEEEAARKTQEEKLREWRYNKRTAEMIAEYERDQEKEAKKSRPERDKLKKPFKKEATRSYIGSRSNGVKPSSPKKAVQKPQSKPVVEIPSTRTEEKRNKGFEKWLESFKAWIHQCITNPRPSSILEEDQEAKDIEPELSTVYVRAESKDDLGPIFDEEEEPFERWTMGDDLDPIFDEEYYHLDDDLGPTFDEEDDHLDDDIGRIFDEKEEPEALLKTWLIVDQKLIMKKDLTTAYASGDILGSFSYDKLVQPFVCKEYDPVKLLRHEEDLQHFIFEPGEETRDQSNNNQSLAKKIAKVEQKNAHQENTSDGHIIYQSDGNSEIFNHAKGRNQSKSSATKSFNIRSTVLVFGQYQETFRTSCVTIRSTFIDRLCFLAHSVQGLSNLPTLE
ncbi:hypothetical protein YC2023_015708 [Brassica napus]